MRRARSRARARARSRRPRAARARSSSRPARAAARRGRLPDRARERPSRAAPTTSVAPTTSDSIDAASRAPNRRPTAASTTPSPRNAQYATALLNASQLRSPTIDQAIVTPIQSVSATAAPTRSAPERPTRGTGSRPSATATSAAASATRPRRRREGSRRRPIRRRRTSRRGGAPRRARRRRRPRSRTPGRRAPTPNPWRATLAAASVCPADAEGTVRERLTDRLLSPHHRLTPCRKTPWPGLPATPHEISLVTTRTSLRTFVALVALVAERGRRAHDGGPASAATPCGKKVLADWFDNGRIDRLYPLNCYEEAIDAIPDDLRDYADAEDVITRALQARCAATSRPAAPIPRRTTTIRQPGLERRQRRRRIGWRRRLWQQPAGSAGRRHVGPVVGADSPARARRNVDRTARRRRARIPLAPPERSRHGGTGRVRPARVEPLVANGCKPVAGTMDASCVLAYLQGVSCAGTYRPARSLPSPARSHDDHAHPGGET